LQRECSIRRPAARIVSDLSWPGYPKDEVSGPSLYAEAAEVKKRQP
jgi:hypothetical protein